MGELRRHEALPVVLIVESNRSLASLISSVLGREGYSVVVANAAEEAIEICAELANIDLLITDVFLPGASGIDLANQVSQHHPESKILFLSSITEEALRKHGIKDGADVLPKPIALSDLIVHVNQLMHGT